MRPAGCSHGERLVPLAERLPSDLCQPRTGVRGPRRSSGSAAAPGEPPSKRSGPGGRSSGRSGACGLDPRWTGSDGRVHASVADTRMPIAHLLRLPASKPFRRQPEMTCIHIPEDLFRPRTTRRAWTELGRQACLPRHVGSQPTACANLGAALGIGLHEFSDFQNRNLRTSPHGFRGRQTLFLFLQTYDL